MLIYAVFMALTKSIYKAEAEPKAKAKDKCHHKAGRKCDIEDVDDGSGDVEEDPRKMTPGHKKHLVSNLAGPNKNAEERL